GLVERLRITNTGLVGIGTTTPWTNFAVVGNVDAQNYYANGRFLATATGTRTVLIGDNTRATTTPNTGTDDFFVGTSAGTNNTTGSFNIFLGNSAGLGNTSGGFNMFEGRNAGRSNTIPSSVY